MLRVLRMIWKGFVKLVQLAFLTFILFISVIGLINLYTIGSTYSQMLTPEELASTDFMAADVPILVLGAGVVNNEEPSLILKQRLDQAFEVYELAPEKRLIMSGDHRDIYYNEVAVMKDYLVNKGVPSSQIYLDHAGYSTYASLYRERSDW